MSESHCSSGCHRRGSATAPLPLAPRRARAFCMARLASPRQPPALPLCNANRVYVSNVFSVFGRFISAFERFISAFGRFTVRVVSHRLLLSRLHERLNSLPPPFAIPPPPGASHAAAATHVAATRPRHADASTSLP